MFPCRACFLFFFFVLFRVAGNLGYQKTQISQKIQKPKYLAKKKKKKKKKLLQVWGQLASFTLSTSKYLVQKEVSIAYSQRCCAHTADVFRTLKTVKPANKGRRLTAYFTTHSTPWLPCMLPIQRITPTQSTIVYSMRPHQLAISYRRAAQSGELHWNKERLSVDHDRTQSQHELRYLQPIKRNKPQVGSCVLGTKTAVGPWILSVAEFFYNHISRVGHGVFNYGRSGKKSTVGWRYVDGCYGVLYFRKKSVLIVICIYSKSPTPIFTGATNCRHEPEGENHRPHSFILVLV